MKNRMKKVVIVVLMMLGVVNFTALQAQTTPNFSSVKIETDSMFIKYPFLYGNVYSDPWAKTKLMMQDYQVLNRVWDYHKKQVKEMIIGGSIAALGMGGIFYAVNMPTPVRQVNNPDLDPDADQKQHDRRIVGASSTAVAVIGGFIFARAFRWHKRINAVIGLQSLRLQYNLTGNRQYWNSVGKRSKKFKNSKYFKKHPPVIQ